MNEKKAKKHLSKLAKRIHATAVEKGWYDEDRTFGDEIALCHSELSEALEAFRDFGDPTMTYRTFDGSMEFEADAENQTGMVRYLEHINNGFDLGKPEGVASELADVIIRVLDMSAGRGIPTVSELFAKLEYNETRSYRHGGRHL